MANVAGLAVFGTYSTRHSVEEAVDAMTNAGIKPADISVLFPENQDSRAFAEQKQTTAPQGTASGPTADVDLAGSAGIEHPATGPVKGALSDALLGMGVPPDEIEKYGDLVVKTGCILLSIQCHAPEDIPNAKASLFKTGAEHMYSTADKT